MFTDKNGENMEQIDTLIGENTTLKGDLNFKGGLHVDGRIEGSISASGDGVFTLSEKGSVKGEVRVPVMVINGTIEGDLYCTQRLELNPDARILTRATHKRNIEAIQRAGADLVLSYASFGEQAVFSIARGRDIVVLGEDLSLHHIPVPASLDGKTLSQADIWARTGLNVVAVEQNGRVLTMPTPSARKPEAGTSFLRLSVSSFGRSRPSWIGLSALRMTQQLSSTCGRGTSISASTFFISATALSWSRTTTADRVCTNSMLAARYGKPPAMRRAT